MVEEKIVLIINVKIQTEAFANSINYYYYYGPSNLLTLACNSHHNCRGQFGYSFFEKMSAAHLINGKQQTWSALDVPLGFLKRVLALNGQIKYVSVFFGRGGCG